MKIAPAFPRCPRGLKLQRLLFSSSRFSLRQAKQWARQHGLPITALEAAGPGKAFHHVVVHPKASFVEPFRTKTIAPGLEATFACPRRNPSSAPSARTSSLRAPSSSRTSRPSSSSSRAGDRDVVGHVYLILYRRPTDGRFYYHPFKGARPLATFDRRRGCVVLAPVKMRAVESIEARDVPQIVKGS